VPRPERRSRAVSENRMGKAAPAQAEISILLTGIGCRNAEKSVRELTKLTYSAKFEPL